MWLLKCTPRARWCACGVVHTSLFHGLGALNHQKCVQVRVFNSVCTREQASGGSSHHRQPRGTSPDATWQRRVIIAMRATSLMCRRGALARASCISPHAQKSLPALQCARQRLLCTAPSPPMPKSPAFHPESDKNLEPIRLYRFAHITALRALLRVKVVQLVGGVGIFIPVATLLQSGVMPTLADVSVVAATVVGTVAVAGSMSWYCERIVGELSWRPKNSALRVSTLTMWGHRRDVDFKVDELLADGFLQVPPTLPEHFELDPYPAPGFVPLRLCGKTYVFLWGRRHVMQPDPLANLLVLNALPYPPTNVEQTASRQAEEPRNSN